MRLARTADGPALYQLNIPTFSSLSQKTQASSSFGGGTDEGLDGFITFLSQHTVSKAHVSL
jgi:hypothetical protein